MRTQIILLCVATAAQSPRALAVAFPQVISKLRARGCSFVTLDALTG